MEGLYYNGIGDTTIDLGSRPEFRAKDIISAVNKLHVSRSQ
jgi:hypothetical protein